MTAMSIISAIVEREGGYVSDSRDLGGETCWGITEAVARKSGYAGHMKDLPKLFAIQVYSNQYINEPGFDKVLAISPLIAEEMIDTGVNMGTGVPGVWLQRILNALNQQAKLYPDIAVDGHIGPSTLAALKSFIHKRGADGPKVIARALNCLQGARYIEISEKRAENEAFLYGWLLNRVGGV